VAHAQIYYAFLNNVLASKKSKLEMSEHGISSHVSALHSKFWTSVTGTYFSVIVGLLIWLKKMKVIIFFRIGLLKKMWRIKQEMWRIE